MSAYVNSPAASDRLADEVVREIGEQVSRVLVARLPKWGDTPLDLKRGLDLYGSRVETVVKTFEDLSNVKSGENRRKTMGNQFEVLYAAERREQGKEGWTTDELAEMYKKDPSDPLFKKYPDLLEYAKTNHDQTDYVERGPNGKLIRSQLKLYEDVGNGVTAFLKDPENEAFVVPDDQYGKYEKELTERIEKATDEDKRQQLQDTKKKLRRSGMNSDDARSPYKYVTKKTVKDASKRVSANVRIGVFSDVVVFSCGGAAWEIRDAYQNPGTMSVLERCERLLAAIWERIKTSIKDRSLREIGSETIAILASALRAPLNMAKAAIERIVTILRRLWMDFLGGTIKSVSDLIAACLKAVVALSIVAVAAMLQPKLDLLLGGVPGGEVLAAVIAAVVAGVMIILANRSIDGVIQGLLSIFNAGAIARRRREEIERICEEALPKLVEDRERLQALADSYFAERESLLGTTFNDIQSASRSNDFNGFLKSLITINTAYGRLLPWASFEEFDEFMLDDDRTLKL